MDDIRHIGSLTLDEGTIISRSPEVEHERAVAIADLLERNSFYPLKAPEQPLFDGPYHLHLSIQESRLCFDIDDAEKKQQTTIRLVVTPFRSIIKDYFLICESYFDAIKEKDRTKVEAIDMGRRGLHNEGAELLTDLLQDKISTDFETARRLFTLMSVLHIR